MKKKILAVMLSVVMAVTMLVGCGDSVETGGRAERKKTETQDKNDKSRTESDESNEIIRLVQGIQYNSDGSVFAHEEWEYNADGSLVKDTTYKSDGSISGGTMVEYERNAAGDVTKAVSYGLSDGNIRGWYEIEYDSSGHEVKYTEYRSDGSSSGWYELEYDAAGNPTKGTYYNSDGSISGWAEREYDAAGNPTKETYYNSDSSIREWYEKEYDASGHGVKYIRYKSDGSISGWYEREYDTSGHEVKYAEYDSDGSVMIRYSKEYDADGHEIKRTYYSSTGSIIGWYERKYDPADYSVQYNLYGSLHVEYENGGSESYRWRYLGPDDGFEVQTSFITPSFSTEDVVISPGVIQEIQESKIPDGYWNIVLFGIDNMNEKQLLKNSRSETCVIISINTYTQEVKLVNINPLTYLNIGENNYNKAYDAYNRGGAAQAIQMLNRNLDLNLTDFISIGLPTWIPLIDGLGGVWVDVNAGLMNKINSNLDNPTMSYITKEKQSDFYIETTGFQQLNGVQMASWIDVGHMTIGDLDSLKLNSSIFERMQNTDPETLKQLFSSCIDGIYTSLSPEEIDTFCDVLGNNGK